MGKFVETAAKTASHRKDHMIEAIQKKGREALLEVTRERDSYRAVVAGSRTCAEHWLAEATKKREALEFINRTLSENYDFDGLIRATQWAVDRARGVL